MNPFPYLDDPVDRRDRAIGFAVFLTAAAAFLAAVLWTRAALVALDAQEARP